MIRAGKEYDLNIFKPKAGVYMIKCVSSNMAYIGQSTDIQTRVSTHLRELQRGKHNLDLMQNHFDRFGLKAFRFRVLERCSRSRLIERESYYIHKYAFKGRGVYNQNLHEAKRYYKDLENLE